MSVATKIQVYSRAAWPYIRSGVIQSVGLAGFAIFIEGIREIYSPAAMIVGGGLLVLWTIMKVRSTP
jgi:hypothetical protein